MADPLLVYFQQMEDRKRIIVQETPKLDIDNYMQNYKGRTRYERLLHIGQTSVPLCVEALKTAIAEAKKGKDIGRYRTAVEHLRIVAPSDPDAEFDRAWMEQTEKANTAETKRLEAELKRYKNNLIKESIRMANEELGKHYEAIGELRLALEAYTRMQPDLSTNKQYLECSRLRSKIYTQQRDWPAVGSTMKSQKDLLDEEVEDDRGYQAYYEISMGLSLLGTEQYEEAVEHFLKVNPGISADKYSDLVSPNDIATYGGLLALATKGREDLRDLLEQSTYRSFSVTEPHLRKAITHFVNAKYSACLDVLESYRPDYLLDVYLQRHVAKLYTKIRQECIVQYLKPFSRVTLESMEVFAAPGKCIEEDLVDMIRAGTLEARIDKIDKVVTTTSVSPRFKIQKDSINMLTSYKKDALDQARRMGILAADLEVKGQRKQLIPGAPHTGDVMYDDGGMLS